MEQEIAQLEASLQQLHSLHQREQTLLTQLSQLEQQARDLQARLDQWDALEKQSALQACLQAQEAFHQAQHRVHSLQDHCPSLPLAEQLSRMSGLADALERMQNDVRRTESAVADAQNDAAIAQSHWEAHPLYPADQQQLSARLDRIVPNNTRFSLWAVLLALLTGSAAGLGLWHVLFHVAAAIAAGAGVCAAHLIIYNSIRLHRNRVAYTQAETQRNALRAEIAGYVQLLQQHNAAQERAQRAGASAQTLHHSYHEGLLQLLGFVHPFAPDAADPAAIRTALDQGLQLRVELDLAQREAADAQQRYDFLRQNLPQGPLPDPTESLPRPSISHTQLSGALLRVTDNIQSLRSQLDVLKGQIHAAGDRDTLESRLARKRSELSRLQEEYQAITTAMDALSRADQTMQSRFSPELGRRAAEIFGALTGGKYRQVLFDRSFALSATPSDGSIPRSIQLLSQGAADQLYLATRLAICEMVLPADKSIPLILDDALANFDQQRMMAALDWLADAARHRQILLFTCHTREIEYLSGRDNVTYLSL